jgi:2-iminobutanoate/2-iminopropanoate deaminase
VKEIISTKNAPQAIGPYSQAILANKTLYTSGQIAIDPTNNQLVIKDIKSETKQVMMNLKAVLNAAEMGFSNVVKCTIFLKNMDQYKEINEVYKTFFKKNPPAREAVQVSELPKSVNIEISAIAVKQ